MSEIVLLSGSPSGVSSTDTVLRWLGEHLKARGHSVLCLSVRDVSPAALFGAEPEHPGFTHLVRSLGSARGLVVGSPVYKASYSGVLKALFDLLPENLLKGIPVLPLMVGGSPNHFLAMDWALRPLLTLLKAETQQGVYLLADQVQKNDPDPIRDPGLRHRLVDQADQLSRACPIESISRFAH